MATAHEAVHPLFIPKGSVRALVTLVIVGAGCYLLLEGREVGRWLHTAFCIVLVYYYAHRSATREGVPAARRQPLFLPRGSVRTLLTVGLLGTVGMLIYKRAFLAGMNLETHTALLAFVAGVLASVVASRRRVSAEIKTPFLDLLDHLKALLVLGAAVLLGVGQALSWPWAAPEHYQAAFLALIAFYFGSR